MYPGSPWFRTRTVRYDKVAREFIDTHIDSAPRFRDIWEGGEGIEWLLCRNPTIGLPRGPRESANIWLYSISGNDVAKTRPFAVVYSFDEDHVNVHAVRFTDDLSS